jgi:hypothetical protein
MRTLLTGLLALGLFALGAASHAQPKVRVKDAPNPVAQPEPAPVVNLAVSAAGRAPRALKYSFEIDPLDQHPGNAAPLWIRTALAARSVRHKWTDAQNNWDGPGLGLTLDKLPKKEVRAVLVKFSSAFRLAEFAARRRHCDWERLPLTIQNLQDPLALPLEEIQSMREIARLLSLRCRLQMSEGRFDEAIRTLRVGFALARHIAQGSDMLIQDLVAIAIAAVMFGRVEEWIQTPGSPNLYWALTEMPSPLVAIRPSIRSELNTIYRSFPELRELKTRKLTPAQAQELANRVLSGFYRSGDLAVPAWGGPLATATMAMKYYPDAKKALIARGMPAKQVEAMPVVQVVVVNFLDSYDRLRDDVLKWLALPSWQAYGPLQKVQKQVEIAAKAEGNMLIGLLFPAILKVHYAQLRTERIVAGLRGAEALRLHAAGHTGKPPAKWADVTGVGDPLDPFTGKSVGAFYKVEAGKGVLDVPPPPHMPPTLGRRYVLTPAR